MALTRVADGVLVHQADFMQSNAVAVVGEGGVLLVDAGITADELAGIGRELRGLGHRVVVGFSTHPHWDHLLWHADFGPAPRYGTAIAAAAIEARLSTAGWRGMVSGVIPAELVESVPLDDLFGRISGLPAGAVELPWAGPTVRVIEHRAHAPGHAALLLRESGALIAGDMLSDVLVPILNFMAPDPVEEYLAALQLLEKEAAGVVAVIPGHGSVGGADQLGARIDQDRAYLLALRDGREPDDQRLGSTAAAGWKWVKELHAGQVQHLAERKGEPARS